MMLRSLNKLGNCETQFAGFLGRFNLGNPKMVVERIPNMGLGVVSTESLGENETILEIPPDLWMPFSAEFAETKARASAPDFAARVDAIEGGLMGGNPEQKKRLGPAVFLALETMFGLGSGHPYYNVMFSSPPDTPLFWDAPALAELRGTSSLAGSTRLRDFVGDVHQALLQGSSVSRPQLALAFSAVWSRAVSGGGSLPDDDRARDPFPFTFVPIMDFFNHSPDPSCDHVFDATRQRIVVRTRRAHAAGEQLMLDYGHMGNGELLRMYGFTTALSPLHNMDGVQPSTTSTSFTSTSSTSTFSTSSTCAADASSRQAVREVVPLVVPLASPLTDEGAGKIPAAASLPPKLPNEGKAAAAAETAASGPAMPSVVVNVCPAPVAASGGGEGASAVDVLQCGGALSAAAVDALRKAEAVAVAREPAGVPCNSSTTGDQRVRSALASALESALAGYAGSHEEDEKLLVDWAVRDRQLEPLPSARLQHAVRVRVGERRILMDALRHLTTGTPNM